MLRDGVCDELTNTERCLWDGGDCCHDRSKIDTTMCKICICKATVDTVHLRTIFNATKVMRLSDPNDFQRLSLKKTKTVEEVVELGVCTVVCLDSSLANLVNAWMYDQESRTCTCSWLKSTQCLDEHNLQRVISPDDNNDANYGFATMQSFVQMTKILPCGKSSTIIRNLLFMYSQLQAPRLSRLLATRCHN